MGRSAATSWSSRTRAAGSAPSDVAGPANPVAKALEKIGLFPSGGHLVKRVIGVAGDTIVCCDNLGRLSVNGTAVDEKGYTLPGEIDQHDCFGPMTGNCNWSVGPVPEGTVFVMGDNRAHSADSTVHMCLEGETECTKNPYVDTDLIVGKVFALVWPLSPVRRRSTARTPSTRSPTPS